MKKYFEEKDYSMESETIEIVGKKMRIVSLSCDETFYENISFKDFEWGGWFWEEINGIEVHDRDIHYGHIFVEFHSEFIKIVISYFEESNLYKGKYEKAIAELCNKWNVYMNAEEK